MLRLRLRLPSYQESSMLVRSPALHCTAQVAHLQHALGVALAAQGGVEPARGRAWQEMQQSDHRTAPRHIHRACHRVTPKQPVRRATANPTSSLMADQQTARRLTWQHYQANRHCRSSWPCAGKGPEQPSTAQLPSATANAHLAALWGESPSPVELAVCGQGL